MKTVRFSLHNSEKIEEALKNPISERPTPSRAEIVTALREVLFETIPELGRIAGGKDETATVKERLKAVELLLRYADLLSEKPEQEELAVRESASTPTQSHPKPTEPTKPSQTEFETNCDPLQAMGHESTQTIGAKRRTWCVSRPRPARSQLGSHDRACARRTLRASVPHRYVTPISATEAKPLCSSALPP